MNKDTQQITIIILGIMGIASIIMQHEQALLIIIGIIGGFLTNKTMTEQQQDTLEKYHLEHTLNTGLDDITAGTISFNTKEEMDEYLATHNMEELINDADKVTCTCGGDDVQ